MNNDKPKTSVYNMVDGIPIWQHLKNGAIENEMRLISTDYGKFAEILGKRLLNRLTRKDGMLDNIFQGIEIIAVHRLPKLRILPNAKIEMGDLVLEINYKNSYSFGKKVVIFEIKHGHFQIVQNQLRRYCFIIKNPGAYFSKADEVKIIFVMFEKIDTVNCSAFYTINELNKNLADKILKSVPIEETINSINTINIKNINRDIEVDISEGLKLIIG